LADAHGPGWARSSILEALGRLDCRNEIATAHVEAKRAYLDDG
jgi:hypothetical protein